jgi:hypothetical protein
MGGSIRDRHRVMAMAAQATVPLRGTKRIA